MSNNIKVKPDKSTLSDYIKAFEQGKIQVPAFQRDFVWLKEKKLGLLDSIKRGYPIGSILLWKPNFTTEKDYYKFESNTIGSYIIPERHNEYFYIIDGYQRLSTLVGCLVHPAKTTLKRNEEEWSKEFNIVYNLADEIFEIVNKKKDASKLELYQIPIYKLIDPKEFFAFQKRLFTEGVVLADTYIERYEEISTIFQQYELPSINAYGGSVTEAIDIFQRLNSMGSPITPDWIISALSFNKDKNFRLGTEIDNLLEDLSVFNFNNSKREVILQCIINSFGSIYFDQFSKNDNKKLEDLVRRPDFIEVTRKTMNSIKKAVQFLFEELYVLDSKILPYNNQLIFITDFFNKIAIPTATQLEKLKKWFWITTYSNYFTIYNLSKQRLAYKAFQQFIEDENKNPIYYDSRDESFETLAFPNKIEMGSVRSKALALFMLRYQRQGKKLDANIVNGYNAYKIFSDKNNIIENTILIIIDNQYIIPKSQKDLSNWLTSHEDHTLFFITSSMKMLYIEEGDKERFLQLRIEEMIEAEKIFIENLGLWCPERLIF